VGGIPPAEPVNKIGSDIFKYTPPERILQANTVRLASLGG